MCTTINGREFDYDCEFYVRDKKLCVVEHMEILPSLQDKVVFDGKMYETVQCYHFLELGCYVIKLEEV